MSCLKIIDEVNFQNLTNGKSLPNSRIDFKNDDNLKIYLLIDSNYDHEINVAKGKYVKLFEIIDVNKGSLNLTINLEEDSNLEYISLRKGNETNIHLSVNLRDRAVFNTKNINMFSNKVSFSEDINARGENSEINSMDVVINSSGEVQKFDIESLHYSSLSNCQMRNFVINKNNSITHMNTNGFIEKGTKGVVINQKTKGLLLDLNSEISANPLLCISEYDCNASHGASIGAINEEELYYLMSRGLTKESSERLIVQGFINPFVLGLDSDNLKQYIFDETNKIL